MLQGLRTCSQALCLIGAALCLSACGATTARLAGWYVTRQLDGYLDLDHDQKHQLRARVDQQLEILQQRELPRWMYLLRQVRDSVGRGGTEEELARELERYDALLDAAANRLVPTGAEILEELDDRQIAHFEARMLEKHEATYEDLTLPAHEQRERLDERLVDALEDIFGRLRDDQQRTILHKAHALPDDRPMRNRVDRERIHSFAKFLRTHPGKAAIETELRQLWDTRYQVLGPGRDKVSRRIEQRRLLLHIDQTLSREQRDHAVEHMNGHLRTAKTFLL